MYETQNEKKKKQNTQKHQNREKTRAQKKTNKKLPMTYLSLFSLFSI